MKLPPTAMVDIGLGSSRLWICLFLLFILRPQDCLSVGKFGQPLVTQRSWPNYPACSPPGSRCCTYQQDGGQCQLSGRAGLWAPGTQAPVL